MNEGKQIASMSHSEIAKAFGVSRSQIQYIERNAMEKIREVLAKRGYKADDFFEIKK